MQLMVRSVTLNKYRLYHNKTQHNAIQNNKTTPLLQTPTNISHLPNNPSPNSTHPNPKLDLHIPPPNINPESWLIHKLTDLKHSLQCQR